jgi:hypothetical protein
MAKRHGDPIHGAGTKVKKRKGIKIRTVIVPDSDDEGPPPNVDAGYARLLKTRVATSGKAESVTTSSLLLFEDKEIVHNDSEPTTDNPEPLVVENTIPSRRARKQRRRKKGNDSVRTLNSLNNSPVLTTP